MTIALLFWIIMLFWLIFTLYIRFAPSTAPSVSWPWMFDPIVFILFVLLGIGVFGWPIKA